MTRTVNTRYFLRMKQFPSLNIYSLSQKEKCFSKNFPSLSLPVTPFAKFPRNPRYPCGNHSPATIVTATNNPKYHPKIVPPQGLHGGRVHASEMEGLSPEAQIQEERKAEETAASSFVDEQNLARRSLLLQREIILLPQHHGSQSVHHHRSRRNRLLQRQVFVLSYFS